MNNMSTKIECKLNKFENVIKIQPNSTCYYWAFQVWKFIISTANFRSYPKFMTENSSHFHKTPCKSPSKAKLFKKESWRSLEFQEWESHRVPNRVINLISMQRQLHKNSNGWCNEILIFSNSLQLKTEMWLNSATLWIFFCENVILSFVCRCEIRNFVLMAK